MCGIIGICSKSRVEKRGWIKNGRDLMRHRGPDDSGEWWSEDGRVGLGHRRLSVIDLSSLGHQPMFDQSKKISIVFNGEIYNFKELNKQLTLKGYSFISNSDTEVILNSYLEWGTDFVTRLNGMFALAIHDSRINSILLARDRSGQKPLFYSVKNNEMRFSSELKGLLADTAFSKEVNLNSFDCYLTFGYIPGENCILEGVKKLPPAHVFTYNYDLGLEKIWSYWNLPEVSESISFNNNEDMVDELDALLEASVKRHLISDVPIGILLSGGVDSSLITAMASRSGEKIRTFTASFPENFAYDESQHAKLIAQYFGTEHTELQIRDIGPEILPTLAKQYDEPMVDSSAIPTFLISQLVRQHCTVALGGDGGDELFGGYPSHSRMVLLQEKIKFIPKRLRILTSLFARNALPLGFKGRQLLIMMGIDSELDLPIFTEQFGREHRKELITNNEKYRCEAENIFKTRIPKNINALQRVTRMDFANFLTEDILVKVDRASMLHSLEIRSPFLDNNILDFAFSRVPSSLKATSLKKKILPKMLSRRLFPANFDINRKQGFSMPLGSWLKKGPWRSYFEEILLDNECIFSKKITRQLFKSIEQGRPVSEKLFALVLFELWRKEYRISI